MGINRMMRLSLSTLTKLLSSSRTVEEAWTFTRVPSARMIASGGKISSVEAVPMNMMIMNAYAGNENARGVKILTYIKRTRYVAVETLLSFPERMLMAKAMMEPMNEPN